MATEYLTTGQVAKRLSCSRFWAWKLISTGEIKGKRVGGGGRRSAHVWVVHPRDLQNYLDKRAQRQGA